MAYIDLTQPFSADMPVYPGDPAPEMSAHAELAIDGYNDTQLVTTMHIGTHIDAPLHMLAGGKTIADYPAGKFVGRGVLVDARAKDKVGANLLNGINLQAGDIVLVCTGWSAKYRDPEYFDQYPEVTAEFAQILIEKKVSLLGLDSASPDREPFVVHKLLLSHDVLIIENLTNLESLLVISKFEVFALPLRLAADAALARIVAIIP